MTIIIKKYITSIIGILLMCFLVGCGKNTSNSTTTNNPSTDVNPTTTEPKEDDPYMNKTIELKIDSIIVDVNWLDNDSVKALKEVTTDGLTINMSMYGGFEQVGSLGKTITSDDERISTSPGDIVLYSSNQIVIFYGSNIWTYMKMLL